MENLGGWLTTIVARVCLNMLRSRNVRREDSFGVHLPDPVIIPDGEPRPEEEALLADSVGLALLVVLDTLDALAGRQLDSLEQLLPTDEETFLAELRIEREAAKRHLESVVESYHDRDWRKRAIKGLVFIPKTGLQMTHEEVQAWLDGYIEAWRTNDESSVRGPVLDRRRVQLSTLGERQAQCPWHRRRRCSLARPPGRPWGLGRPIPPVRGRG